MHASWSVPGLIALHARWQAAAQGASTQAAVRWHATAIARSGSSAACPPAPALEAVALQQAGAGAGAWCCGYVPYTRAPARPASTTHILELALQRVVRLVQAHASILAGAGSSRVGHGAGGCPASGGLLCAAAATGSSSHGASSRSDPALRTTVLKRFWHGHRFCHWQFCGKPAFAFALLLPSQQCALQGGGRAAVQCLPAVGSGLPFTHTLCLLLACCCCHQALLPAACVAPPLLLLRGLTLKAAAQPPMRACPAPGRTPHACGTVSKGTQPVRTAAAAVRAHAFAHPRVRRTRRHVAHAASSLGEPTASSSSGRAADEEYMRVGAACWDPATPARAQPPPAPHAARRCAPQRPAPPHPPPPRNTRK